MRTSKISMRFIILTRRDPSTDFRRSLADALRAEGYPCYVILVRRMLVVEGPHEANPTLRLSPIRFLKFIRKLNPGETTVVIDSLNLGDPLFCLVIRVILSKAIWAYDIHDDLLYDLQGFKRLCSKISLRVHLLISNLSFHASPSLLELYPKSIRLGNASHLVRREKRLQKNLQQILVLASIDERFDFELVRGILEKGVIELHIFGSLAEGSTSKTQKEVRTAFHGLCNDFPNVTYFGAYNNEAIEAILDRYQVMLAPYKVNHFSTRYIEPLRYYHALNRGLEVISTPIPALRDMAAFIHVIESPDDFWGTLRSLSMNADVWRNDSNRFKPITWRARARSLVTIMQAHISHQIAKAQGKKL
jgi:hypothetical protein